MFGMYTSTPELTPTTAEFCRSFSDATPVVLRVTPCPADEPQMCFINAAQRVGLEGGAVEYGWSLRAWPGVLLEAEHHAVWRRPDGQLIDVTPTTSNDRHRTFISDPSATYDEAQYAGRANKYLALVDDPLVNAYIESLKAATAVLARPGSSVSKSDLDTATIRVLNQVRPVLAKYLRPNHRCFCGSGIKYKHCCAKTGHPSFDSQHFVPFVLATQAARRKLDANGSPPRQRLP